jgi:hypothetical protein
MTNSTKNSLTVPAEITAVLRSAGERSKELCYRLLCDQLPPENIIIIEEYPFTRALRKSFEIGIELRRSWTLCVDADMLLRQNGVKALLDLAREGDSLTCQVQGNLFDKLLGKPRRAGPRLYRTSLLPRALACIPADGAAQRPETNVRDEMALLGYRSIYKKITIGVHDFEQYYRDLYRKAFLHAHKHDPETHRLEPLWERLADQDIDYQVALHGLHDGREFEGIIPLDVRRFPREFPIQGLKEKGPLILTDEQWDVERLILEYCQTRLSVDPKRAKCN